MNSIKKPMNKTSKLLNVSFLNATHGHIKQIFMDRLKTFVRIIVSVQSQIDGLQNQIDNFECTCDDEPIDQTPKPTDYNLPADYTYADTSFGGVFYKYYGDNNRNRFSKIFQIRFCLDILNI